MRWASPTQGERQPEAVPRSVGSGGSHPLHEGTPLCKVLGTSPLVQPQKRSACPAFSLFLWLESEGGGNKHGNALSHLCTPCIPGKGRPARGPEGSEHISCSWDISPQPSIPPVPTGSCFSQCPGQIRHHSHQHPALQHWQGPRGRTQEYFLGFWPRSFWDASIKGLDLLGVFYNFSPPEQHLQEKVFWHQCMI